MRLTRLLKMKLLTHNMLTSHVKNVKNGYPFTIEVEEVEELSVDYNPEFIAKMIPRIEWNALRSAMDMLGKKDELPEAVIENFENNEDFLKKAHHALMEIEVIRGNLVCPESGRKFPISRGIPNMLLNEDEV